MKTPTHGLSFDLEDWYQSCVDLEAPISSRAHQNIEHLLDLMESFKVRSTLFVQAMVAQAFPDLIRQAANYGHEIATHGYSHRAVFDLGSQKFQEELLRSIQILEEITGQKIVGHRAPDFSITEETPWAFEIMAHCGLKYDSSIFPIRGSRYGIAQAPRMPYIAYQNGSDPLWEAPLATLALGKRNFPIAGGGYMRHYPLWFIHWTLHQLEKEGKRGVLYFHPYETDTRETLDIRRNRPWKERLWMFRQGLFRNTVRRKWTSLFRKYTLVPLRELLEI